MIFYTNTELKYENFQLHGHVHEKRPKKIVSNQLNLCVEVWDYKPVYEKTLLGLFDKAAANPRSPKPSLLENEP